MKETSLSKSILRLTTGILLATSVAILGAVWISATRHAVKQSESSLEISSGILDRILNNQKQKLLNASTVLASDFGFRQAVSSSDTNTITSALQNHGNRINSDMMLIASLSGEVITSFPEDSILIDTSILEKISNDISAGSESSMVIVLNDKLYQTVYLPVRAPVPIAIVLIGFEIDQIFVEEMAALTKSEVTILAEYGNRFISLSTIENFDRGTNDSKDKNLLQLWLSFISSEPNYFSEPVRLSESSSLTIELVFSQDMNHILRELIVLSVSIALIVVLSASIAILLTMLYTKNMTSPLNSIVNLSRLISQGKYQKPKSIRTNISEITRLSDAFFDMQKKLIARERKIKSQNKYYQRLLETMDSIIIGVSTGDKIIYWNPGAERFFNVSKEEVLGKSVVSAHITWEWSVISKEILKTRTTNTRSQPFEVSVDLTDGGKHLLSALIAKFLHDDNDSSEGYLIIAEDITTRRLEERQRQQAAKLQSIGHLASGIAHEINTPIQYVGDNIRFLNESFSDVFSFVKELEGLVVEDDNLNVSGKRSNELNQIESLQEKYDLSYLVNEVPEAIDQSEEGIRRITSIIAAMKEFSHPGSEEKVPANLNQLVDSTVILTRNAWKYIADLDTDLDKQLLDVPCLPDKLNEVFVNLIVNASDAIEHLKNSDKAFKGKIHITTTKHADFAEIRLYDNGGGIPEPIQARIFDPFFTTKDVGKGTGQGLSICHDIIVQKHGGQFFFETEKEKSTTFVIQLPLGDALT